jgi:hypothetical protein
MPYSGLNSFSIIEFPSLFSCVVFWSSIATPQTPNILTCHVTVSIAILHPTVSNKGAGDSQAYPPESRAVRRRRVLMIFDLAIALIDEYEEGCFINAIVASNTTRKMRSPQ